MVIFLSLLNAGCKEEEKVYMANGTVSVRNECEPEELSRRRLDTLIISAMIYNDSSLNGQLAFGEVPANSSYQFPMKWGIQGDAPNKWKVFDISAKDGSPICPDRCVVRDTVFQCQDSLALGALKEKPITNGILEPIQLRLVCKCITWRTFGWGM